MDTELQRTIALCTLEHKEKEAARVRQRVQEALVSNSGDCTRLLTRLVPLDRECTELQEEFKKNYGPRAALVSGAAQTPTLPTNQGSQTLNGSSGAAGPNLDPTAAKFQPTDGILPSSAMRSALASVSVVAGDDRISMQEYEALLDPEYVADQQWKRDEQQKREDELLKEKEEMAQRIQQLEAEQARAQQVSHGSMQTDGVIEPPLQNSTAIGGDAMPTVRPGVTHYSANAVYVPPIADTRQGAAKTAQPYSNLHLGPREHTDLPESQVPMIDAKTAQAMHKVSIRPFIAASRKWVWWRHDFQVQMLGVGIPESHWVAVLPSHLDDKARDAYEELTGARRGKQTIAWTELADLFELRFQDKVNPNNAMLLLQGMKFDRVKDDFTEFSMHFY
ncbi:MAG: hypothetical protein GY832_06125, partial [Chloroflexi bacterium]|nr:hypothetical protein [Chloroflexota bacterium]